MFFSSGLIGIFGQNASLQAPGFAKQLKEPDSDLHMSGADELTCRKYTHTKPHAPCKADTVLISTSVVLLSLLFP